MNFRKLFLRSLIITLCISAANGIILFLMGEFGRVEVQILFTTLAIGAYSLTALASSVLYDQQRFKPFSVFGMILSGIALLITIIMIWEIIANKEFYKITLTAIFSSISVAHISLMLLVRPKSVMIWQALRLTILMILIVCGMLIVASFEDFQNDEFYFRILGVFVILDILGTITTPLLNRMKANETSS